MLFGATVVSCGLLLFCFFKAVGNKHALACVPSVYHPTLFSLCGTKHAQPCALLESCLAILRCFLYYKRGFSMPWKQRMFRDQK